MKIKQTIIIIICFLALIITKKEHSILSSLSDKLIWRQNPQQKDSDTSQKGFLPEQMSLSKLIMIRSKQFPTRESYADSSKEQNKEELDEGRKHVLIMASTRTGSSFLGDIFNQHGEIFYLYEPLSHVKIKLTNTSESNNKTIMTRSYQDVLRGLFLCDFSPLEKFISPPPKNHTTFDLYRRDVSVSLCEETACTPADKDAVRYQCDRRCGPLNLTLASQSCLSKQYEAIKTICVEQLEILQPLVKDPHLNLKIIQLVRDPRAIIASRMVAFSDYQEWINWAKIGQVPEDNVELMNLKEYCDQIKVSAELGLSQPTWLKRRYMLVRYEDITRSPMEKAEEMYKFAGIPFNSRAREWIVKNTQNEAGGVYSTQRKSSEQADKWRFNFPFMLAQAVQKVCEPTMKMFGYKFVDDEKTLFNKSISLFEEKLFN